MACSGSDSGDNGWVSLFNGVNLEGWDRYLGKPSSNPSADELPLELNIDPKNVFSVTEIDQEPAIQITGEIFGALISKKSFKNFELELEYRWGTRVFPPLNAFDSGVMYASFGPYGAVNAGGSSLVDPIGAGAFLVSMEFQIATGDVGSPHNLGPVSFIAEIPPDAVRVEQPGWNLVQIRFDDGVATHALNRSTLSVVKEVTAEWPEVQLGPLREGRLQLQSEGGEIYFRRLRVRELP